MQRKGDVVGDPTKLGLRRSEEAQPNRVAEGIDGSSRRMDLERSKHLGLGIDMCGLIRGTRDEEGDTAEEPNLMVV